jgi:hypothetical protein
MSDHARPEAETFVAQKPPRGLTAMGVFLFFGAAMAALAGTTLAWPGTLLDKMWKLNPEAYRRLTPLGRWIGVAFLLLSAALAAAGAGWFRRKLWGYWLAVIIIVTQVLGDLFNLFRGDYLRGGTGFVIAGALLLYLLRAKVKAEFAASAKPSVG